MTLQILENIYSSVRSPYVHHVEVQSLAAYLASLDLAGNYDDLLKSDGIESVSSLCGCFELIWLPWQRYTYIPSHSFIRGH